MYGILFSFAQKTNRLTSLFGYEVKQSLVGLTPGLNIINVLCTAFTSAEPKSVKRSQLVSLFMLSESVHPKAARKYVGEIDQRSIFTLKR